jgi:hypothetical protein
MHRLESIINAFNRLEPILIIQKRNLTTVKVVHPDLIWSVRLYITYMIKQQGNNFGFSSQHVPAHYGQGYWLFQI